MSGGIKIETLRFRMPHSLFVKRMFLFYGRKWFIALGVVFLALIAVGLFLDIRWIVVALMVLFLVAPMAMAFLYYSIGLRRECSVNVMEHQFVFSPEGVETVYYISNDDEETEDTRKVFFKRDNFKKLVVGLNEVFVMFRGKGFLWIPQAAFKNADTYFSVIENFNNFSSESDS